GRGASDVEWLGLSLCGAWRRLGAHGRTGWANSFAKRRYARGVVASAVLAVVALAVARRKGRSVGRCRTVIAVQRGLCPNALPLGTGPAACRFCYVSASV